MERSTEVSWCLTCCLISINLLHLLLRCHTVAVAQAWLRLPLCPADVHTEGENDDDKDDEDEEEDPDDEPVGEGRAQLP